MGVGLSPALVLVRENEVALVVRDGGSPASLLLWLSSGLLLLLSSGRWLLRCGLLLLVRSGLWLLSACLPSLRWLALLLSINLPRKKH